MNWPVVAVCTLAGENLRYVRIFMIWSFWPQMSGFGVVSS